MSARRILIVDDSRFTGDAVAWALRKAGFEAQVARDLWDLESPDILAPDLVLMDVVLQEAFGDDLAPLLRVSRGFECPILLLSSLPDAELEQRAGDAGLDGFISKNKGLATIVARVSDLLGRPPPTALGTDGGRSLELDARQALRRIVHVSGDADHWNLAAIVAEAHALAGDADLVGARELADAARALRDTVREHGHNGRTPEIDAAIDALATASGASTGSVAGKLLVVDASGASRATIYPELDRAGYVIVEAHTLAEARQKLHAAKYDLILVDDRSQQQDPALVPELRESLPDVPLEVIGRKSVEELRGLARRR